jgi:hypothetical protein
MRSFLCNQNTIMADGWKLKLTFRFMQTSHEPLHLQEWRRLVQKKIVGIHKSFISIVILFDVTFKYVDGEIY